MSIRSSRRRVWHAVGLAAVASACITDPALKLRLDTRPPAMGDGWAVSTPTLEGFDEAALGAAFDLFYADTAYFNAVSLLIARNNRLVAEAYARSDADRDVIRHVQSVTKSVTSLVFGIARGDGFFPDLNQALYGIMPEKFDDDPAKRGITLDHLLTMRSGILFDNEDFSTEMIRQRHTDQARYILGKPLYNAPGVEFFYRDADPQLLSSAVEAVTGRSLAAIAAERLFGPLGITDYVWEANVDGSAFGGIGLFLKPRDLLKIGQLALQDGQWHGTQLVPADWMALATDVHTSTTYPDFRYGYYWWIVPELDAYTAWGHGGQFVLVVPADQLVVLMTSLPSADDDDVGTMLPRFLPIARRVVGAIVR